VDAIAGPHPDDDLTGRRAPAVPHRVRDDLGDEQLEIRDEPVRDPGDRAANAGPGQRGRDRLARQMQLGACLGAGMDT
jgi:hypothetical protein